MAFKIYTKTGDKGTTGLYGGARIPKHHIRIESYGTVDELNSHIGLLMDMGKKEGIDIPHLVNVQNELFNVGSILASDPAKDLPVPNIETKHIERLEKEIDRYHEELPPLKAFILPSGHPVVSQAHVCRCVCRRAERLVVALNETEKTDMMTVRYLNRLSDYLFTLSRYYGLKLGVTELEWKGLS